MRNSVALEAWGARDVRSGYCSLGRGVSPPKEVLVTDLARTMWRLGLCLLLALVADSSWAQQSASARQAVPVDPIPAILEAFRSHSIVALGEGIHGNEQGHAFRLSLIRDSR